MSSISKLKRAYEKRKDICIYIFYKRYIHTYIYIYIYIYIYMALYFVKRVILCVHIQL